LEEEMGKKIFKLVIALIIIFIITNIAIYIGKRIAKKNYPLIYRECILAYSKEYQLDPYLVAAVIKTESNFKAKAASRKSAKGLMQLMDDTSKWISVQLKIKEFNLDTIYDPESNIRFGTWYLGYLSKKYNGNTKLILAAYNGGMGNVSNWLTNPEYSKDGANLDYIPFKETENYVKKVNVNYNIYKYLYPEFYIN
jgi:soluble lytic murein transglycosylase